MAKAINIDDAPKWSKAELDENIAWLNSRGRSDLIAQVGRLRDASPSDLTGEVDGNTVRPDEETPSVAEKEAAQAGIKAGGPVGEDADAAEDKKSKKPNFDDATVDEIMEWVGDDKRRARSALKTENEYESPRVTLVEQLEKVLED